MLFYYGLRNVTRKNQSRFKTMVKVNLIGVVSLEFGDKKTFLQTRFLFSPMYS